MDISKTKTSLLASLQSKKMRLRHGLFIVEGEKSVKDTLGAFELADIVATGRWLETAGGFPGIPSDRIMTASEGAMRKISSLSTPPEVLAVYRLPKDDEDGDPVLDKDGLHLLLDGIQDPGNLGTIIRTADWFGFTRVYASRDTADVFNPKTVQATMGSLRRVKVIYTDLADLIKRSGVSNVYGTMLEGDNIYDTNLGKNGVIVMGNEGNGLSEEIRTLVSKPILIPPYNPESHAESLNVAVATGIVLAAFRQTTI